MSLNLLLENHWLALMASVCGGGRVSRTPGALVVTNPVAAGMSFNFIALRQAEPDTLAATLEAGAALLAGEGRAVGAWLSPASGDMAGLRMALAGLGWRPTLTQSVLAVDLPHPSAAGPGPGAVRSAHSARDLATWGRVLVQAYEVEPVAGRQLRTAWTSLAADPGPGAQACYYLARQGRQAVGTGLTWLRSGLAGLYCGAVLPACRRQGVERALVQHRLADAAAQGATLAFTQTESGSPVEHLCVDRLGFRLAYRRELYLPPGG